MPQPAASRNPADRGLSRPQPRPSAPAASLANAHRTRPTPRPVPFPPDATRTTQKQTEARNLFVSELATALFIAHAAPGSHTETIRHTLEESGKTVLGFQAITAVTVEAIQIALLAKPLSETPSNR